MATYKSKKNHEPIDPDVKLPAAIRAASNRASEIHRQAYTAEDQQEPTAPTEPPVDPTQENTQVVQEGNENGSTERQPTPPNTETTPPAKGEPEPVEASGPDDWEHKYKSIKGRYDRQETMISQLNSRINQMQGLLERQNNQPTPPPARTPENTFKPLTPEDREAYGDDFLDVASRAAMEKVNPEIERLQRRLDELTGKVTSTEEETKQSRSARMYSYLDEQVPDWRTINRNQDFIAWTNLPDPFSGVIRQNMMQEAFNKGDAARVARFFQGFLKDEAATAPANTQPTPQKTAKVPLENLAAPGRAKAPAASEAPGEKETITRAQIAKFYADVNAGKYRGNDEEKQKRENEIFAANVEGRVI